MTIYFSGQGFKYELEGVAKLFLPLVRFNHIYDKVMFEENSIITRLKRGKTKTYLWIYANIDSHTNKACCSLNNNDKNYTNECERLLCILLYNVLNCLTECTPEWGILTGIRPVASINKLRQQGKSDSEIAEFLSDKYLVSQKKLDLCFLTSTVQAPLLQSHNKESYSLYVSIPFCYSRCSYCSFVSSAIGEKRSTGKIDEYVRLLCVELEYTAKMAVTLGLKLDTIYIGGGTPTALNEFQLKAVTDAISENFDVKSAREYTIEAGRADSITKEKLIIIKNAGATRISVNPQTFNDDVLKEIGRNHTAKQAIDCYLMACDVGFTDINMDFIAGLPTETIDSFKASIDKAITLAPSNITVHTLSIKRSSTLFEQGENLLSFIKENKNAVMTEYARDRLIKAGYRPYYLYRQKNTIGNLENVGYSKPGFESVYNVYIMDEVQTILACGAGGVTKLVGLGETPISRIFNYKYHFEYIDHFDEILRRKEACLI